MTETDALNATTVLKEIASNLERDHVAHTFDGEQLVVSSESWEREGSCYVFLPAGGRGLAYYCESVADYCASVVDFDAAPTIAVAIEATPGPSPWVDGDEYIVKVLPV